MITQEDIDRLEEEAAQVPRQTIIIDTMQFFEIEIPADQDPQKFIDSDICRQICADKVLRGVTDLKLETVIKEEE